MSSYWQWQDESRWQSCSEQAQARAQAWLANSGDLQQRLKALTGKQPLLSADASVLEQCKREAQALRAVSEQLVVVGTGGASLGAQALCALSDYPSCVRFLENCDPTTIAAYAALPADKLAWCIVSKSGETVETLAGALSLIAHYAKNSAALAPRVRVVTGDKDSTLGRLARRQGWSILDHPAMLGGRFSVFSLVGLLPASYCGLDIASLAAAANQSMQHCFDDAQFLSHAAWLAAASAEKPIHVIMAYSDQLRPATQWYKQLWAESLGKDGKGSTLVTAIGAIDQHSQLQLYLGGPRDKLMTLWLPTMAGMGAPLPRLDVEGLDYLGGHRMGEVMNAAAEATVATLTKAGVPIRVLRGKLNPQSLAAFLARQMLETIAVALLIGVDPYSQPAVEEGKQLTRAALGRP